MNKRLLAVAIGALASASALATPVITDPTTGSQAIYAPESLGTKGVGNTTLNKVEAGGIAKLDVDFALGTGVALNDQIFIRFDLSGGAKFDSAVTMDTPVNGTAPTLAQGGVGQSFVIYSVSANTTTGLLQTEVMGLNVGDIAVAGTSTVTMTVATYETLGQAANSTLALGTDTDADYVTFESGLDITATSNTETASVAEDYLLFIGAVDTGELGTHAIAAEVGVADADTGAQVVLNAMINDANLTTASTVTYTGDFSFGDFYLDNGGCGGSPGVLNLAERTGNVVNPTITTTLNLANGNTLCVEADGDTVIPVASYTLGVDFVAATGSAGAADLSNVGFGTILHDGTELELPYITTFTGYNQRLVITNKSTAPSSYQMVFTTEDGVTATAGAAATGTLAANEVTVVRMVDAVTLTGGTRASAVVIIPSVPGAIDAAVTQVNLSDGGTDTVVVQ